MKAKRILKEAGVLLIAITMIFSTVVVSANTETSYSDVFEESSYTFREDSPNENLITKGPVIFEQLPIPDDTTGHGPFSDAGPGYRVYDNFWDLGEDIYDVHWWGLCGYGAGEPQPGTAFEISFCADNGGIPDYNNHIVDFTGTLGTEISFVGTGNFYWGYELFYFEIELPSPVSMTEGWLSVYKTTVNAQTYAMIDALTGDGKAYQVNAATPLLTYDVAFQLTGASNLPPDIPSVPDGPTNGATGVEYTFTTSTTDPEGENIFYQFDWDGDLSPWIGPVSSGTAVEGLYTWTTPGTFNVRARAKDINDRESDWSAPHQIEIIEGPVMDIRALSSGLFRVKATIENDGAVEATDVAWTISLVGGAFIGAESSGTIASIPPGGSVEVQSGFILGLGATTITVTAEVDPGVSDTRQHSGTILLFFIKINPGGG